MSAQYPPDLAYNGARCILHDLFGQSHVVARSLIDDFLVGLKPFTDDYEALSQLSLKTESGHIALSDEVHGRIRLHNHYCASGSYFAQLCNLDGQG